MRIGRNLHRHRPKPTSISDGAHVSFGRCACLYVIKIIAETIGVQRCGHPLGCEELWGNREGDEGTGAAYCGAWERKKRVDIAGWLCLHAFIIDHADGGMLFTSLLHPSRCKPTCSTRLHERSRHQRR